VETARDTAWVGTTGGMMRLCGGWVRSVAEGMDIGVSVGVV
jgi:hypothetical protein